MLLCFEFVTVVSWGELAEGDDNTSKCCQARQDSMADACVRPL